MRDVKCSPDIVPELIGHGRAAPVSKIPYVTPRRIIVDPDSTRNQRNFFIGEIVKSIMIFLHDILLGFLETNCLVTWNKKPEIAESF